MHVDGQKMSNTWHYPILEVFVIEYPVPYPMIEVYVDEHPIPYIISYS